MSLILWHAQIEMEQNKSVAGRQEAGPSGVLGSIVNGGENNDQGAAAAGGAGDPTEYVAAAALSALASGDGSSGVLANAGVLSRVVAGAADRPSGVAAGGGTSGYAGACGQSGIAASDGPSGFVDLSALAALAVGGGPTGYAAASGPSGVAGPSSQSASGKRKRNQRHSEYQINAMEA